VQAPKKKPYAAYLTVWCPTTQSSISTTIATDVRTLAKAWHRKIKVSCPHCREIHNYRVSEAFVEAALSNAHLRGELTIISDPHPLPPHASPPGAAGFLNLSQSGAYSNVKRPLIPTDGGQDSN
jgi:phage FluMu protein Com